MNAEETKDEVPRKEGPRKEDEEREVRQGQDEQQQKRRGNARRHLSGTACAGPSSEGSRINLLVARTRARKIHGSGLAKGFGDLAAKPVPT
jgi:hypothetical protein